MIERSLKLSDWQAPDGSRPPLATLPFKDEELSPPDALQDEGPTNRCLRKQRVTKVPASSAATDAPLSSSGRKRGSGK